MNDSQTAHQSAPATKAARPRGTGFPSIPLSEVTEVLMQAGKSGWHHTLDQFAEYMGHSTTNSGTFKQKMSAFKDFGVISRDGESVSLTPLGQRIALPSGVHNDDIGALREAFLHCEVFRDAYEQHSRDTKLELDRLGAFSVHRQGVLAQNRERYARSLTASAVAAGLAEFVDGENAVKFLSDDSADPVDVSNGQRAPEHVLAPSSGVHGAPPASQFGRDGGTVPASFEQFWSIGDGGIQLSVFMKSPIPARLYGQVGEIVEQIEKLAVELEAAHKVGTDDRLPPAE